MRPGGLILWLVRTLLRSNTVPAELHDPPFLYLESLTRAAAPFRVYGYSWIEAPGSIEERS